MCDSSFYCNSIFLMYSPNHVCIVPSHLYCETLPTKHTKKTTVKRRNVKQLVQKSST